MNETQKNIKTIRYFILFLNSDLAKGGASPPLALPLVAPLLALTKSQVLA